MLVPERPSAVALPDGGVAVAGSACAELLSALRGYQNLSRGVSRPASVPAPRWTAALAGLERVVAEAAVQNYRLRASRGVVAATQIPSSSALLGTTEVVVHPKGEVMTVDGAAGVLGVSPQRVRVLAAVGVFPGASKHRCRGDGRRAAQRRWCIPVGAVHAYLVERRGVA